MINNRFNFEYRDNASKRHKLVGEVLRNSIYFQNYQSYQEWPVEKVNPKWTSGREHFDWVVPALKLVVEVHGYKLLKYKTEDLTEAFLKQYSIKCEQKEQAAIDVGWTYILITNDMIITADNLLEKYRNFYDIKKPVTIVKLNNWTNNYKNNKQQDVNSNPNNIKRVHRNKYSNVKSR